ncbi:unnamed protein product [Arabidopsis lyrata]|uniref:Uncharacterized protein n=1 Tax=Arabidopsis suecica TaxID=45249 RepID=A0A8T2CPR8_ARASU|nr:hypothetical protein ISN44_As06g044760 [Arabidopsis suecica]CAH8254669.1 unnamed protein product [Arabidopsis lyrata]
MLVKPSTPEAKPAYTTEKASAARQETRLKRGQSHRKRIAGNI